MYTVTKEVDSFDVRIANNGFMIAFNGRNDKDDYVTDCIVKPDIAGLVEVVEHIINLPKE